MARIPLVQQRAASVRDAQDSQNSKGPTVLPFPSPVSERRDAVCQERRDAVCQALRDLAAAWQALDIRDEVAWSVFAADAGVALARYLLQHAVDVRTVMLELGRRTPLDDASAVADTASMSTAPGDGWADGHADVEAERAADAAVLALVGLTSALGSDDALTALVPVAVGTRASGDTAAKLDPPSRHAARRVS